MQIEQGVPNGEPLRKLEYGIVVLRQPLSRSARKTAVNWKADVYALAGDVVSIWWVSREATASTTTGGVGRAQADDA